MEKRSLHVFAVLVLLAASLVFAYRLLTAGHPTHSDVFFLGEEGGVFPSALMGCLMLIGWLLYRLFFRKEA